MKSIELKERIAELDQLRDQAEARIHDLISTLPNIPHESVPVGKDESANAEIRRWGDRNRSLILNRKTTSTWALRSAFSILIELRRLPPRVSQFLMATARDSNEP